MSKYVFVKGYDTESHCPVCNKKQKMKLNAGVVYNDLKDRYWCFECDALLVGIIDFDTFERKMKVDDTLG